MTYAVTPTSSWVAAITADGGEVVIHTWRGQSLHYGAAPWLVGAVFAYLSNGRCGRMVTVLLKRYGRYLLTTEAAPPEQDLEAALRRSLA